jgi:type IV secretion system protein VirD4
MNVHFVGDEANSLGHLELIGDVLAIGRGYGIRLQLYYQDLGQVRRCWPNGADQTLLANTTQVFFGVNDQSTAEYVSNRLGEKTIVISSGGTSTGESYQSPSQGQGSRSTSTNTSHNWSQIARKLLKPEEVTALNPRTAIVFTPGVPPIASTLVRYYEKSFRKPRRKGLFMATVETVCLFITVAALAAICTAMFFPNILEVFDVQGIEGLFREGTGR